MVLFNYTQACQFANRWNWFERHSRGLILDMATGEILARPFNKFFNYGERLPAPDVSILEITEKLDGSLGTLYRRNGDYHVATRGSFTSEQAHWATDWLREHVDRAALDSFGDRWTLLFEIIYPANRIVVDYKGWEGLYLLGVVDRTSGDDLPYAQVSTFASAINLPQPRTFTFDSFDTILGASKALSVHEEGWVIRTSDGERYKVKGSAYKIAHRIMTGVTFNRVLEAVASGALDAMISGVPDEFLTQIKAWRTEIEATIASTRAAANEAFADAPKEDRKTFALWVQSTLARNLHPYMFAMFDGKDITPVIYRSEFRDRKFADAPSVIEE